MNNKIKITDEMKKMIDKFDDSFNQITKNSELIKKMFITDGKDEITDYSSNEYKLFDYFIYKIQRMWLFEKTLEIERFEEIDNVLYYYNKKGDRFTTFLLNIDLIEINNFLNVNSYKRIKTHLKGLNTKFLTIESNERIKDMSLITKIGEDKKTNEMFVLINFEFLMDFLNRKQITTMIDINIIKIITSKYTLKLYEEFSRVLENSKGKEFTKSYENIIRFFGGVNISHQQIERIIYRTKKEMLEKKIYSFDFSKVKNKKTKEWIFRITNITIIDDNLKYSDIIKTYLDYCLVSDEIRNEIETNRELDFDDGEIGEFLTDKEKKKIENRVRFLHPKRIF